jgi:hypothetical protein
MAKLHGGACLYAGILTLVAAPQAFALANRRQVIIYGAIAFACFLILTFPYFRYAFWLFSGDYYRTAGFFIVIFLLFLAYRGISQIVQKSEINLVVLVQLWWFYFLHCMHRMKYQKKISIVVYVLW